MYFFLVIWKWGLIVIEKQGLEVGDDDVSLLLLLMEYIDVINQSIFEYDRSL